MESILIITYYYPPCIGVAAYRPLSWVKDFQKYDLKTTVITRHWIGNENVWVDYQKELGSDIKIINEQNSKKIYVPYRKNKYLKFSEKKWIKFFWINKLVYFFLAITGKFQPEVDGYTSFKEYLFKHLKTEKYKIVIVNAPPLNLIRLVATANKKFKIPFIVDFQDSWDNMMLSKDYNPGKKEKFYNSLKVIYLKKWLNRASFIITVTPSIASLIQKITNKPVKVIMNGFEKGKYIATAYNKDTSYFNISLIGTVHPIQDISMMLEGLKLFLKGKDPRLVKLNFIGINSFPEISQKVKMVIPNEFLYISDRVSMDDSVRLTLAADVLLFPSYSGYADYYTAKIFEYLGAGRNILMVPGNNDAVDDLILETASGKIANSVIEFAEILEKWHMEWKNSGTIKYHGITQKIDFYSRENQNEILCNLIKSI